MKRNRRFFIRGLSLITLLILVTAGCARPGSTPVGEGANLEAGNDGVTTISVDWPTYVDPGVGGKYSDSIAFLNMYDTLTFPNSDGSVSPFVAKSWDVSPDSTEYTFHLRDDIIFHSGNRLTSSDVKFSMDRLLTMGEGYAYLFIDVVDKVEVIDEQTVLFKLKNPSGTFPAMVIRLYIMDEALVMANIDPSGSYGTYGDYGKAWMLTNDAGSGPYKIKEMKTEEYLLMERYADYWGGWEKGAPEGIKLIGGIDGATLRTMMSRGELDFSNDAQTQETYNFLESTDGISVVRMLTGANFNLCLNTQLAPTDDVHVRRAMAYAMDYQGLIDNVYVGSKKSTGPVVSGIASALSASEFPYHYDLGKAKEELAQSRYYDDLVNGRMAISLTWCSEGGEQQEKLALLMQAGMAALDVKVEITGKPFAMMMTDAQTVETTPNASVVLFSPAYLDAGSVLKSRYHSSSCGSWEQMEWLQDDRLDAMIERAMTIPDDDERNALYTEIQKELVDLCPTLWLLDFAQTLAYNSDYVITYPAGILSRSGEPFIYAMGYGAYFRDFRLAE